MLVVVADTHSREGSRLRGRTLAAVREADLTIHAGDFYREPVLDAFESTARRLSAVFGNNADAAVRDRLPASGRSTTGYSIRGHTPPPQRRHGAGGARSRPQRRLRRLRSQPPPSIR